MKTLKGVYNTFTHKYEDIEVTEAVYNCYRRTGWNIDDNDQSFFDHEIQMSGLIGGDENAYENFREFISDDNDPLLLFLYEAQLSDLRKGYAALANSEKHLISAVIFQRQSEREYSQRTGIPPMTVHDRKVRTLKKLKKLCGFEK